MMSKHIKPWNPLPFAWTGNQHLDRSYTTSKWTSLFTLAPMSRQHCCGWTVQPLYAYRTPCVQFSLVVWPARLQCSQSPSKVNYSIDPVSSHCWTTWREPWRRWTEKKTLCQVTTSEVDAATKLLDKACQKLQGIQDVPSQRVTDLEAAIRQLRQLSCILDSCTTSASYEVSQAQKAILLLPHTAKVQARHPKSLMHRYHHTQMMSTIFQLMKTIGKSTSVPESTANPGSSRFGVKTRERRGSSFSQLGLEPNHTGLTA